MEENNQTTEVATATNTGQAVSKPPKKKSSMPTIVVIFIVFAAIIGFSFFLCIVYKVIFPYQVYKTEHQSETWRIQDIRELYFKKGSTRAGVAMLKSGFCVYEAGEGWEAEVPLEYGDYTFTGDFYFNADDELRRYYYRGVSLGTASEDDLTMEEYNEFLDFVSQDVGCSPEREIEDEWPNDGYVRIVDTFSVSDSMVFEMTYDIYDDMSFANFDFES